jgi:hypothetical protein
MHAETNDDLPIPVGYCERGGLQINNVLFPDRNRENRQPGILGLYPICAGANRRSRHAEKAVGTVATERGAEVGVKKLWQVNCGRLSLSKCA